MRISDWSSDVCSSDLPDLGGVVDQSRVDQHGEMPLVFAPALEALGQAGARQLVEDAEAIAHQPRPLALPERRGSGERQQMRQEVADLIHQVHAQFVVAEAYMDVPAADDTPPPQRPPGRAAGG